MAVLFADCQSRGVGDFQVESESKVSLETKLESEGNLVTPGP